MIKFDTPHLFLILLISPLINHLGTPGQGQLLQGIRKGVILERAEVKSNRTKVAATTPKPFGDTLRDRLAGAPLFLFNSVTQVIVNIIQMVNNLSFISQGIELLEPESTTLAPSGGSGGNGTKTTGKQTTKRTRTTTEADEEEESKTTEPDYK